MVLRCCHCGNRATAQLCTTCLLGITRYPDQNAVIFAAYVDLGLDELARCLELHTAFDLFLTRRRPPDGFAA